MRRLRIALYHNLHSGGAKRVVAEHLRRLRERHDVELFSLKSADSTFAQNSDDFEMSTTLLDHRPLAWLPSPFGRLNTLIGLAEVYRLNQLARQMALIVDKHDFDVVLAHPCQVTQAPLILKWLKTPSVYYCHELPRWLYEKRPLRPYDISSPTRRWLDTIDPLSGVQASVLKALDRKNAQYASLILVNSHFTRVNVLNAYGYNAEVCYPGVDTGTFASSAASREGYVLSVGALTPMKGFDFVIMALGSLPEHERPPLLIISNYQEDRELQYLRELASQNGVQLTCLTNLSDSQLKTYYERAGCIAYAPVNEPFGLVALEAMASSVPIVGVDEGGIKETIIDNDTGRLVERNQVAFGKAIKQVLQDSDYATALGRAGRQSVLEKWTWTAHIEKLEKHLLEVAGTTSPFQENEHARDDN